MVKLNKYHLDLALSVFALGSAILNISIDEDVCVITTFFVFVLNEIVLSIKSAHNLCFMRFRYFVSEHVGVMFNIAIPISIGATSIVGSVFSESYFLFYGLIGLAVAPVFFSAVLLYTYDSYVTYDLYSVIRMFRDRSISPPSMDYDLAVVELRVGQQLRVFLPSYSKFGIKPPRYSMFEDEPPIYDYDQSLEDQSLISDRGSCPSYGASRRHEVIEGSEFTETIV